MAQDHSVRTAQDAMRLPGRLSLASVEKRSYYSGDAAGRESRPSRAFQYPSIWVCATFRRLYRHTLALFFKISESCKRNSITFSRRKTVAAVYRPHSWVKTDRKSACRERV